MTEKQKNTIEILEELWRFEKTEKYTETQIREALSTAIESVKHVKFVSIATITYDSDKLREIVNEAIENARPHGEWKKYGDKVEVCDISGIKTWGQTRRCTNCGEEIISTHMSYCGNCGAIMGDGEEKKSCINCGSSECELGNRARYGFCGNWTMKEGEQE